MFGHSEGKCFTSGSDGNRIITGTWNALVVMAYDLDLLTEDQRRILRWLADEPQKDSVGSEIGELSPDQIYAAEHLVPLGLVRVDYGWRMSVWYRITPHGRAVLALLG